MVFYKIPITFAKYIYKYTMSAVNRIVFFCIIILKTGSR